MQVGIRCLIKWTIQNFDVAVIYKSKQCEPRYFPCQDNSDERVSDHDDECW